MNRDTAARILELADACTETIASAIESTQKQAPGPGADFFKSFASPAWGNVVMGFISPVWDQYPDLAEVPEGSVDEAHDPDRFNLPKEVVVEGFRSLGKAQRLVADLKAVVSLSELRPDERERCDRFLGQVESELQVARLMVTEQHPDFRGPDPKEKIPE